LVFVLVLITSCVPVIDDAPPVGQATSGSFQSTAISTDQPTGTLVVVEPTLTLTPLPTDTPTPTLTAIPTDTPFPTGMPTLTPTPGVLRGTVLERSNCRYGPGAVFLYKYGLLPETNMEVIGRDEAGTWLLVRAIGGDNPCWLRATLMSVRGDVMTVALVDPDIIQAWSPYYGPLTGVSAYRSGGEVLVSWDPLITKAGDEIKLEASQMLYVIEAWVCRDGQLTFTVIGSNTTTARIPDEAGCSSPSHGRVYAAEKHGYTPWVEIPWP